jgi:hypothetical protein
MSTETPANTVLGLKERGVAIGHEPRRGILPPVTGPIPSPPVNGFHVGPFFVHA